MVNVKILNSLEEIVPIRFLVLISVEDFILTKWFKIDSNGYYHCLHCNYKGKSFMGITSHIPKHKRERERLGKGQKTLDGRTII